jgi:hypothetical protein
VSCVGPHRRWDEGVVFGGGDVHPWGDGAGDMRIALFGVVVGDGSGGEAQGAAIWRCAVLDHFRHGCTAGGARRGVVVTPEEAVRCVEGELTHSLPCPAASKARSRTAECGWVAGTIF